MHDLRSTYLAEGLNWDSWTVAVSYNLPVKIIKKFFIIYFE